MSDAPTTTDALRALAHDMRNAIGAIRTAAELLQRRYRPDGRDQRLFEVIFSELERLDALVGSHRGTDEPP
jgi:nitrogen-specific signal transduction histidine kinase